MSGEPEAVPAGIVPQRTKEPNEKRVEVYSWFVSEEETVTRGAVISCISQVKSLLQMEGIVAGYEIVATDRLRKGNRHFLMIRVKTGNTCRKTVRALDKVRNTIQLTATGEFVFTTASTPSERLQKVRKRQKVVARGESLRPPQVCAALAGGSTR